MPSIIGCKENNRVMFKISRCFFSQKRYYYQQNTAFKPFLFVSEEIFATMKEKLPKSQLKRVDMSIFNPLDAANTFPDRIATFDGFSGLSLDGYLNLQAAVLMLVRSGTAHLEVNMVSYSLAQRDVIVVMPDQIIRILESSADFEVVCFAWSKEVFDDLLTHFDDSTQLILKIKERPVSKLAQEPYDALDASAVYLKKKFASSVNNPNRLNILQNLLSAFLYEYIDAAIPDYKTLKPRSRKEALFHSFLEQVQKNHREEHSVQFYATELGITPKYLSAVCEEISNKNAKRWIDEHITLDAKALLRSTTKDVQQISNELHFPDMSFFGKFFKRMTGVSPKAFRKGEG